MPGPTPLVSVIIPSFNRAGLITETILSVINQTYKNWECLIVDDGSTDNSVAIIKELSIQDKRIRFFKRDTEVKGAPSCRNIGIKNAEGVYIIFLDSDDIMESDCLEHRVQLFKQYPEYDFLVFQSMLFEFNYYDIRILWNIDTEHNDLDRFLKIDAIWPICGPIYRKSIFLKVGWFRTDLKFWQDYDLHLRLLLLNIPYKKCLDLPPDCLIRHHFNESVSRSISFTGDVPILEQRINFFYSQIIFAQENGVNLSKVQQKILWDVLYFFTSCCIREHNKKWLFTKYWFKTGKLLKPHPASHFITYLYPFIERVCKSFPFLIRFKTIYLRIFKRNIANGMIIYDNTLQKVVYLPKLQPKL